ncbi:hypothetical protein GE061_000823 [Apolygus lucorum]|uniref:RNase H type-1 domain-containing protein n=1 Tax=Apolygus lucorum TaxID=248454 RepID=A0A6A4K0K9_APOLU|nr:hypothetical protein GE061_000823 [Apolygus lucorum]
MDSSTSDQTPRPLMRTGVPYWKNYTPPQARLVSQLNFSSVVGSKARELNLDLGIPEPFPQDSNYPPFSYDLDLTGDISKSSALPAELRAAAIQTVQERYPPSEWLHVYTDGSADGAVKNGGAGNYSAIFEISEPVGLRASNFDGEIVAVQLAVREVERQRLERVIFVDSQAAILALGTLRPSVRSQVICDTLRSLQLVPEYGGVCHLQWIPSHCGVRGNEKADRLAKEGARKAQPNPPRTLHTVRREIAAAVKCYNKNTMEEASAGKDWEILATEEGHRTYPCFSPTAKVGSPVQDDYRPRLPAKAFV